MKLLFVLIFFLFSLSSCISEKICSDKDRGCSTQSLILSNFSAPSGIYLYASLNLYQGDLGKYGSALDLDEGAQNICAGSKIFASIINLGCSRVRPFVSTANVGISLFASLYGVPTTIPVRGARGDIIGPDWATFISSIPLMSLSDAGVTSEAFWTFSNSGGAYNSTDNCLDGTSTGAAGMSGDPFDVSATFYSLTAPACSTYQKVLCICY